MPSKRKKLKEQIDNTWFEHGYPNPLSAALANPDLLSEESRIWIQGDRNDEALLAAKLALSSLTRRQALYINFAMQEYSERQIAAAMCVHRSTVKREMKEAIDFLRSKTDEIMREKFGDSLYDD